MTFLLVVAAIATCYYFYKQIVSNPHPVSAANSPGVAVDEPYVDDPALDDEEWWIESNQRFETLKPMFSPSTVESLCQGGDIRSGLGDHGAALAFYIVSIDKMHTQYIFLEMRDRSPSPVDAGPIEGYIQTLRTVRQARPGAPIASHVRDVTHRLRTMASAAERRGLSSEIYHDGLKELAIVTTDIDVSDIYWE